MGGNLNTGPPNPVAILLVQLARQGIELQAAGDRLRYRPRSAMTPDLAERLKALRDDLLAALRACDAEADPDMVTPTATYMAEERRMLADATPRLRATLDAVKATFADTGGATMLDVRPDLTWPRRRAARLIRAARRAGDHNRGVAMRDAWRERVAICQIDGVLALTEAERVAIAELDEDLSASILDTSPSVGNMTEKDRRDGAKECETKRPTAAGDQG